jgi:hypothetical protein
MSLLFGSVNVDTLAIARLATNLSTSELADRAGVGVLKKALDIQAANAAALIDALPPVANLPAHLGQNIDTTA